MKLKWLLISLLPLLHLVLCSNEEEQGLRLPELAVTDELGDQVAVIDGQKDSTGGEDGEQRRVRGRNVKRRRRLRKRYRTTTEPPQEELNEQLNIAEQNPEAAYDSPLAAYESQKESFNPSNAAYDPPKDAYDQPKVSEETPKALEEPVTAIPVEDTTRRRGKRRRRPHRKHQDVSQDGQQTPGEQEGNAETPKPPRRRRKGGRKRMRPQVEPTEPNKVELFIETTVMPVAEVGETTLMYIVDNLTEPPVTKMPELNVPLREPALPVFKEQHPYPRPRPSNVPSPVVMDHTDPPISIQGMIKEEKPTVFRYYDSRHNSISVIDGNEQSKYPDLQQIPEPSRLPDMQEAPEVSRYHDRYPDVKQSRFPEAVQFNEQTRFPGTPQVEPTRSHQSINMQQHPTRGLVLPHFPNPSWSSKPPSFQEEERSPATTQFLDPEPSIHSSRSPAPTQFLDPEPTLHTSRSPESTRLEPKFTVVINHEPEVLTVSSVKPKPYSARPTANIIKPVKEHIQESEFEPSERHESRVDQGTNELPSQAPTQAVSSQPEYGSKAFDRKALFSKSRKLPVTSAIIRKKLTPQRSQAVEGKAKDENSTQKLLIPEGYTEQPLTMEPSKLIEKLKAHARTYRTTTTPMPTTLITTEEPNYPKFESKKREKNSVTESIIRTTTDASRFNKVIELHRSRGKTVITTTRPETVEATTEGAVEVDTTETGKVISDEIIEETTVTADDLNLDKLNDSIVELLKSESGNMELTEILESRNMTLAQLLEHREKGSRHFHLGDLFSQKKSLIGENTTASMASDKEEAGTPVYLEHQTIPFPNQEVLGSFPTFVSDKIEGGIQKNKEGLNESVTRKSVHLDNREPRVFDSMPEFNDKKDAPWKVPNPKLRPVSIRGDVEEIKISLRPSENPKSENDIDNPFLAAEDKADVLRTNRISSTLEAESVGPQESGFAKFKRIPVTVKSAIIISVAILMLAIFGFLSLLISCRLRQKKARLRAKQEILCEHLKNEDFMNSQQSLSPVLNKQSRGAPPVFSQNNIHPNTASNRHYYLWRTLRKTFQYD